MCQTRSQHLPIIALPRLARSELALQPALHEPASPDELTAHTIGLNLANPFKRQTNLWATQLKMPGPVSVCIEPGMDFAGPDNWWNEKTRWDSHREPEHRGIDLAYLVDNSNRQVPLNSSAQLIWLTNGTIVSQFKDLVGQSIVVLTADLSHLLFYVHTNPTIPLRVGASVEAENIFGTIAEPLPKSNSSAHLHFGVAVVKDTSKIENDSIKNFEDIERLISEEAIQFVDPKSILISALHSADTDTSLSENYLFIQGVRHACWPRIEICTPEVTRGREISRIITRALPGIRHVTVANNLESRSDDSVIIQLGVGNTSICAQVGEISVSRDLSSEDLIAKMLEFLQRLDSYLVDIKIREKIEKSASSRSS